MTIFEVVGNMLFQDNNTRERLNEISDSVNIAQTAFNTMAQSVMQAGSVVSNLGKTLIDKVTMPLYELIKTGVTYNMLMEDQFTSFEVMLGSAKRAREFMDEIIDMAANTPFETSNLSDASKTLLGFGVEAENVIPIMSKLGDVSLGNETKFKSLNLVMGQVRAGSKLTGGDLLQFINAGWNPLQEMVEMTGKSYKTLRKEMEEGNITFDMVSDALDHATSAGGRFYQGMEKGSQTLSGRLSTLKDNFMMLLGDATKPLFDFIAQKGIPFLTMLLEKFNKLSQPVKTAITVFAGLAGALGPVLLVIGGVITSAGILTVAIGALASPITAVIAGIGAFGTALGISMGVTAAMSAKVGILQWYVGNMKNMFMAIVNVMRGNVVDAFNILTQKFGLSNEQASNFIVKGMQARDSLKRLGSVIKDTGKLILSMFSGNKAKMMDIMVSKFGMSEDAAKTFMKEVMKLRDRVIWLGDKLQELAAAHIVKFFTAIKKASKFIYDHRQEIIKAIKKIVDFGNKVYEMAVKVKAQNQKVRDFANQVKKIFNSMKTAVKNYMNDLLSNVKYVFGQVKSKADTVVGAFNKIKTAVQNVINKVSNLKFPSMPSWMPGFAQGVRNFVGGYAVVGEEGPEIVKLPPGSDVIPNERIHDYITNIKPMMEKGSTTVTNVTIDMKNYISKDADSDQMIDKITQFFKSLGVSVKYA